jgi:hypothetical protein
MFRSTYSTILRGRICRTLCCYGITRSYPDKSTGHAQKLTVSTYRHILHKTIKEGKSAELKLATAHSLWGPRSEIISEDDSA